MKFMQALEIINAEDKVAAKAMRVGLVLRNKRFSIEIPFEAMHELDWAITIVNEDPKINRALVELLEKGTYDPS